MPDGQARAGIQQAYNRNRALVANYCCARCWGRLVEKATTAEGGEVTWTVECPKGCQRGFIRMRTRDIMRHNALTEVDAIRMNYPELDDTPRLSPEELSEAIRSLWGE